MAGRTSDFMPLAAILVGAGAAFGVANLFAHGTFSTEMAEDVVVDHGVMRHAIIVDGTERARRVITVTRPHVVTKVRVGRLHLDDVERVRVDMERVREDARAMVQEALEGLEGLDGLEELEGLAALEELKALEQVKALNVLEALVGFEGELHLLGLEDAQAFEVEVRSGEGDEQHRRKRRRRRRPGG